MGKFLKKVLPQSLRRRIRIVLHDLADTTLDFDLNLVFRVGDDHLFLDGWFAGPGGQIVNVDVLDENGTSTNVPFTAYQFTRADVFTLLKGAVPPNRCIGYRLLIKHPLGSPRPRGVTIRTSEGASFSQSVEDAYTDALRHAWKMDKLSTTPGIYGLTQPIAKNPIYNRLIFAPSKALLKKQTSFEGLVDGWHRAKDGSMLIFGWIDDAARTHGKGYLRDVRTNQELPPADLFRFHRADLKSTPDERLGMLLFVEAPGVNAPREIHFQSKTQDEVFLVLKDEGFRGKALLDMFLSIYELCRGMNLADQDKRRLYTLFIPIIESVHAAEHPNGFIAEEVCFGQPPTRPKVSIVLPIYKEYALVLHQIAHLSGDAFIIRQDIIFVLDAPEDAQRFKSLMHRLYDLYQVPVRVLIMNKNSGFARACNAGASAALAPNVLFLNADVFPKHPGWLESMLSRLEDNASIGVVGSRLLFPNGSVQHVELTWRREARLNDQLINYHPWKGVDPSLVPHRGAVEVPAVTAACLLCRTEEFRSVGMFDEGYIRGDFEDSDLCLKMRAHGKRVVCDHEAVLYHLENTSYPSQERRKVYFYNAMRHELRWGPFIAQLINHKADGRGAV